MNTQPQAQEMTNPFDDEIFPLKKKARALLEQGYPEEAEKHLQKALALEPGAADILHLLGRAAHAMENHALAVEYYNRSLKQGYAPETFNAMADVFISGKQGGEVLKVIKRAEEAGMANYDTMVRKGFAYLLENDLRNSFFTFMQAINQQPESRDARVFTSAVVRAGKVPNYSKEFQQALLNCLRSDDMEHYFLIAAWAQQIKEDPAADTLRKLYECEDYDSFAFIYAQPKNREYVLTPFFRLGMERMIIIYPYFEQFLKHLRRFYLETVFAGDEVSSEEHNLVRSLAIYCFLTEYAMSVTEEEKSILLQLRAHMEAKGDYILAEELGVFAAYESLNTLANANDIAGNARLRRSEYGSLIKLQIDEPAEEARIKKTIEHIVPIEDDVSKAVQGMYEENPYPRWLTCNRICPLQDRHISKRNLKMLIAGCGSGRQVIQMASIFPRAEIEAVDLSSSSLAYAIRKAKEYNIDNVTFRQGDILKLGEAFEPESFDRVECTGVLHHMKDPMAGWRVITDLLKPGGLMTLGIYSEISRQPIIKARELIAAKGFKPTLEGIRACRDYIMSLPKEDPVTELVNWRDFYSTSDCRDMIFHVQEHRFTLLQIKDCLDKLGLEFSHFTGLAPSKLELYRKHEPGDGPMRNLELWHKLEEENKGLFFSIYQFVVRKKGGPAQA